MDRLKREGNPPVGQLASPVPQYKDVGTEDWEIVQGEAGASYVKDRDVLAKLIEVQSELALVKAELQEIKANQLSGDQKVQLSGTTTIVLDAGVTELFYQGSHLVVVDTSDVSRVVFEVASEMYTNVLVEGKAANGEWAPVAPSHEFWKSYVLSIPCMFDLMRLTITNVGRRPSQLFWTIGGYLV